MGIARLLFADDAGLHDHDPPGRAEPSNTHGPHDRPQERPRRRASGTRASRSSWPAAPSPAAAYKLGGLKALDDFLVNRKTTDFDIYVGLSAGAFLAAPLAGGVTPARDAALASRAPRRSSPSWRRSTSTAEPRASSRTKPVEFALDLLTYLPGVGLRLPGPDAGAAARSSRSRSPSAATAPSLGNLLEPARAARSMRVGSAREFPFPLDVPAVRPLRQLEHRALPAPQPRARAA